MFHWLWHRMCRPMTWAEYRRIRMEIHGELGLE